MKKPYYDDVDGNTSKFLPLVNKYVEELEAINRDQQSYIKALEKRLTQQQKKSTSFEPG